MAVLPGSRLGQEYYLSLEGILGSCLFKADPQLGAMPSLAPSPAPAWFFSWLLSPALTPDPQLWFLTLTPPTSPGCPCPGLHNRSAKYDCCCSQNTDWTEGEERNALHVTPLFTASQFSRVFLQLYWTVSYWGPRPYVLCVWYSVACFVCGIQYY